MHLTKAALPSTLVVIACAMGVIILFINPITPSQEYHYFADTRTFFSIPNALNVASNILFILFGSIGLYNLLKGQTHSLNWNAITFFVGIFLTGFGSTYYHWQPNETTLVWDRLPMTIAFMGFFSFVLGVFINGNIGKQLLLPLLAFGFFSIVYWQWKHDLKWYAYVQFAPIILTMLMLFFSEHNKHLKIHYWLMVLFYGIAKGFEHFDKEIFESTSYISGHTLKHIAAACSSLSFLTGCKKLRENKFEN
jgi:hypothetical protein